MKQQTPESILGDFLNDTCNRYLNALDDLGIVDKKARHKKTDEILKMKNSLLDEWTPFFAEKLGLTDKK
jgi:hypothetical protein